MLGLLLGILFVLVGWLYFDSTKKHRYWKTKRVHFKKPLPFFGNAFKMMFMLQSQGGLVKQAYNENKDKKYVGLYEFNCPVLIPIDNELVGRILVQDFSHFVDHGIMDNQAETEVDEILFTLQGSKWRALRYKMSPAFSTGKLRGMFSEMLRCSDLFVKKLDKVKDSDMDMNELTKEFSMTIIASCAFGVDIRMDQDSEFMKMGTELSRMSVKRYAEQMIHYLFPPLAKICGFTTTPKHVAKYFANLIKETFSYRIKQNVVRNDFVQILLELKQKGNLELSPSKDNEEDKYLRIDDPPPAESIELTDNILISQAYSFIQAGFDGLTLSTSLTLFELTQNQKIQDRAREDIQRAVNKHGGLTYEALKEATYLNNCVKEGLRKYPLCPVLYRKCTKKYILIDGVIIDPGTMIYISVLGIHNDPDHFPEPKKFRPERFEEEIKPFTYMAFGDGPRMCIATRMASLMIKLACAVALLNFKLELSPNTRLPLRMDLKSFFPKPMDPVLFKLTKL